MTILSWENRMDIMIGFLALDSIVRNYQKNEPVV